MESLYGGSSNSPVANDEFGVVISLEHCNPNIAVNRSTVATRGSAAVYDWLIQSMSVSAQPGYGSRQTAKVPDGWAC